MLSRAQDFDTFERQLWREAYVAAIRAGHTYVMCLQHADKAVGAWRANR